jgi:oligopeptide transport system ATP-binding protein
VGCAYAARCPYAMQICADQDPEAFFQGEAHFARCWLQHTTAPRIDALFQGAAEAES